MHRGTTIEDAGYKGGHSWPIVPDIKTAQESETLVRYLLIAAVPSATIAYFLASGAGPVVASILAAVVLAADLGTAFMVKKKIHDLLVNCKMIKLVAEYTGSDVEHAAKEIFNAVKSKGETERIVPLSESGGVYVNAGYKMDDGRVELPYIIHITKVNQPQREEAAGAA